MLNRIKRIGWVLGTLFYISVGASTAPTPESFFGFKPGDDGMLFNYQPLIDYLKKLDESSDRMEIREIGISPEGKKMYIVFISSPENIKNLDQLKSINKKLALDTQLPQDELARLKNMGKVFAMITLSMHSDEVGPTQASPMVAYQLATTTDSALLSWLDNVVLMVVPSHNPDGMDMVVNNFKKYKGTKYEGCDLPAVYHKYVGHDNNRDFVTLTQSDTRAIDNVLTNDWYPQVLLEKHQMWESGVRYFVPPNHDPIAENIDEQMWNWTWVFGSNMAQDMTREGLAGVSQHYLFDNYWPGSTETALWKNVISLLTEAASIKVAKPVYVEPNEIAARGKGLAEHKKSINLPLPWEGGWWRLSDLVEYELISTFSYLKTSSTNRAEILKFRSDMAIKAVEKGETEPPYYFIFPKNQHDIGELVGLVKLLKQHGVHVYELKEDASFGQYHFAPGDVVVPLAQPYRAFIKEVMEKQKYPERHYTSQSEIIKPYDITSWSLPLHRGLNSYPIDEKIDLILEEISEPQRVGVLPEIKNFGPQLALSPNNNEHYKLIFGLLNEGKQVKQATHEFRTPAGMFPAGSFIINSTDFKNDETYRKAYFSLTDEVKTRVLKMPSIAIVESYRHDMDAGWTRWLLDQYGVKFEVLHPEQIIEIELKKFQLLVFPNENKDVLMTGKYKRSDGTYASGELPPEYMVGMTDKGLQKLMAFIDQGGNVVSWGSSTKLFMGNLSILLDEKKDIKEEFSLPITDISAELTKEGLNCTGSLLSVKIKGDSRLTYGLPENIGVFTSANPVFQTQVPYFDIDRRVLGTYSEDNILLSGYAEKNELLALKPAIVWVSKNKGQLLLMSFDPQFRGSTSGTYKLLFNSFFMNIN